MFPIIFYLVQVLRVLAGLVFLYQCTVFVFHFSHGLIKGENGITRGLLVLYLALLVSGLSATIDGVVFWTNFLYDLPRIQPTSYLMAISIIRLVFIATGCVGNHLLYFSLRKTP